MYSFTATVTGCEDMVSYRSLLQAAQVKSKGLMAQLSKMMLGAMNIARSFMRVPSGKSYTSWPDAIGFDWSTVSLVGVNTSTLNDGMSSLAFRRNSKLASSTLKFVSGPSSATYSTKNVSASSTLGSMMRSKESGRAIIDLTRKESDFSLLSTWLFSKLLVVTIVTYSKVSKAELWSNRIVVSVMGKPLW